MNRSEISKRKFLECYQQIRDRGSEAPLAWQLAIAEMTNSYIEVDRLASTGATQEEIAERWKTHRSDRKHNSSVKRRWRSFQTEGDSIDRH